MATECRKSVNRYKIKRIEASAVLAMLVLIGLVIGFFIGKTQSKTIIKTETVVEMVEVPSYEADKLPEISEVFYFDVPLSHSLQRFMYEVCADEEIPITLILAMIELESSFNPEVISKTDDYGLLQINSINHEWLEQQYQTADMLDPYQNVYCGTKIISSYIKKYEGDYTKALMAYNMGNYGASKAWENGIYSTGYTDRVLSLMQKYEEVVKNAKSNDA